MQSLSDQIIQTITNENVAQSDAMVVLSNVDIGSVSMVVMWMSKICCKWCKHYSTVCEFMTFGERFV